MTKLEPSPTSRPRFARLRKPAKRLIVALLVVAALLLIVWGYFSLVAEFELREAIAEADRLDPGWRLEELEAKRAVVPDDKNSALLVLAAAAHFPKKSLWLFEAAKITDNDAPQNQLSELQVSVFRKTLEAAGPGLATARDLVNFPQGRYPSRWMTFYDAEEMHRSNLVHEVEMVLELDVYLRAQEGDIDGALTSCQALLNVDRSVGDSPSSTAQLHRQSSATRFVKFIQRTLAQGEASETSLAAAQRLLEEEDTQPVLLTYLRGERVCDDRLLQSIHAGETELSLIVKKRHAAANSGRIHEILQEIRKFLGLDADNDDKQKDWTFELFRTIIVKRNRAWLLKFSTQLVEIAKWPTDEYEDRLRRLEATAAEAPYIARAVLDKYKIVDITKTSTVSVFLRGQAKQRCGIVALAVERFRRMEGHWPRELTDLVPRYLARIPTDPYDGQPLRFRHRSDGVVVYSVGPDKEDNGGVQDGSLYLAKTMVGTDLVFRLWNVDRRRQPAVELLPKPTEIKP
jgi:hypothetical protein